MFSVHYHVYNNYTLISETAFGRCSRELIILITVVGTYLKNGKNLHFAGNSV